MRESIAMTEKMEASRHYQRSYLAKLVAAREKIILMMTEQVIKLARCC